MAETYKRLYGVDWDVTWTDTFINMTVAKKWRLFKERWGVDIAADPGECLEKAMLALFPGRIKMSPWTQQMVHDFAREDRLAMIGCGACGKSFAMAACGVLYWLVDPFDTAVVVGSATLKDLASRAWAPTLRLFSSLKGNKEGVPIPGKIVHNQYMIANEKDASIAESVSVEASIQGRALEEGRLQGLHLSWVCLIVDELALIRDIESLKESITNISIGTLGFKCINAANPDPWDSPNSCFYLPKQGEKVDVDTGVWRSSAGYLVRHYDGLKSPVVLHPELKQDFPFLMSKEDVQNALDLCNGDPDNPRFWKMIRGFPLSNTRNFDTVLDPLDAARQSVTAPLDQPMTGGRRRVGLAAGVDPAWSEGGDDAIFAGVEVVEQDGRTYLDFSGRLSRLPLKAESPDPVTLQLRQAVIARILADGGPHLDKLYVDSSGNQGLADDLDIYVGPGCGHINASFRASDVPLRTFDPLPARKRVRDRGAEAWVTLAEFCRAGQVRGLPQSALDGLVRRRFALRPGTNVPVSPLRLENKEAFITRHRGSPNETDACALAALAVRERLGVMPYGSAPAPSARAILTGAYREQPPQMSSSDDPDYDNNSFDDIGLYAPD